MLKKLSLLAISILTLLSYSTMDAREFLFSSESVTEGHPDKICDQISDAILDAFLEKDKNARVACETVATKNTIFITGEISSFHNVNLEEIARETLHKIGYVNPLYGISDQNCNIITLMSKQSPDIAQGVDREDDLGAGDQGLMFGYACDETEELMPLPISLSHKITKKLSQVRKEGILPYLRPDGKTQVTIKYEDNIPKEITTIVIAAQHDPDINNEQLVQEIKEKVITPICKDYLTENTQYHINGTGVFIIGGPEGDSGLTGRKIIVDTYGGMSRHGGGCFSGKDPSKVDRSASYMARHIAKNIVKAKLAKRCEIQLAYCIGVAEPVSVYVDTFNTSSVDEEKLTEAVKKIFPLKPKAIIEYLDLQKPIYQNTASYGHFGRDIFPWEKTNKVDELIDAVKE
jgi:S-adenosylmethionine synthetase